MPARAPAFVALLSTALAVAAAAPVASAAAVGLPALSCGAFIPSCAGFSPPSGDPTPADCRLGLSNSGGGIRCSLGDGELFAYAAYCSPCIYVPILVCSVGQSGTSCELFP
jgi:hypothetical protein